VDPPDTILIGDTVPVTIEALNRSGNVIPGAPVFLKFVDTLSARIIGIADSVYVVGLPFDTTVAKDSSGQVAAGVSNLTSFPFRIVVRAP